MRYCKGLLEVDEGFEIEGIMVSFEGVRRFLGEGHFEVDALRGTKKGIVPAAADKSLEW